MKIGGVLYFGLWVIGVVTVKGFWLTAAAVVIPIVGPFYGVVALGHHFGIL